MLQQLIVHTPIWVWLLLAFLISRGIAAFKPADTSLVKLAIVPVIFAVWGIWSITQRYAASPVAWGEWLLGIAVGIGLGWLLLRRMQLSINPATGKLRRSPDFSLLPLLLITFLVKYGFEVVLAVSPAASANAGFSAAYLLVSGGFTGIFIGKYIRHLTAARRVTVPQTLHAAG